MKIEWTEGTRTMKKTCFGPSINSVEWKLYFYRDKSVDIMDIMVFDT